MITITNNMIECTSFSSSSCFKQVEALYYTETDNKVLGISNNIDLVSGSYEGGLKLWECSIDLLSYLKTLELGPLRVLELGCEHGLPGIYCTQLCLSLKYTTSSSIVVVKLLSIEILYKFLRKGDQFFLSGTSR